MNEKQIKRHFEDRGLKIADVARALIDDFPGVKFTSADMMLRELIGGRRWYPVYVAWLKAKYNVTVDRPKWLQPVRERMRQAA